MSTTTDRPNLARGQIASKQRNLFRELLRHVWNHSPFYREYYESHGVREKDLPDVTVADLPFLSKKVLMDNFDRAATDRRLHKRELEEWLDTVRDPRQLFHADFIVMHGSGSSGTTGIFVYGRTDSQMMNTTMATRLPEPENPSGKTRVAFYRAVHGHFAGITTALNLSPRLYETLMVSLFDPMDQVIEQLHRFQPHRLTGYSSSVATLADAALQRKLHIHPQTVFVSGDLLTPDALAKIQQAWGAAIYNLYGASESLFLGVHESGREEMALMDDLNIFEVLDEQNRLVGPGEDGRVVITNLYNHTLPVVRYELGDHAVRGNPVSDLGFSTIRGIRLGKAHDTLPVVLDNGEQDILRPSAFTSFYAEGLERAQFISEGGRLWIDYVSDRDVDSKVRREFQRILELKGASRMRFEVRRVSAIVPDVRTGKVRLVVVRGTQGGASAAAVTHLPTALAERQRVAPQNPFVPFPKTDIERSIAERFVRQAREFPARTAVKDGTRTLTYRELNRAANRVAHAILAARGAKEEPVALLLEQGTPALVAILGVLKAGKFYVPLDPAYPHAWLSSALEDSTAALILTNKANLASTMKLRGSRRVLNIDALETGVPEKDPGLSISPGTLVYLFYTSGSTGTPKGVVQTHRNVLHQIMTYTNGLHLRSDDRLSLLHSHGFSASRLDIFGALLNGAALIPFPLAGQGMHHLAAWLLENEITVFHWVPTAFRHFAASVPGARDFPSVRLVVLGSEPLLAGDVELYRKHFGPHCILVNRYGATESGNITWHFLDQKTPVGLPLIAAGYPAEDTEVLILDESGKEMVESESGEIAVRSRYLSPGYWRRPEWTRAVFSSSAESDARTYRTGDVGRKLPDGSLLHLGRKDSQVKIRGHRVDLGEIERTLLQHAALKEAVAAACEKPHGSELVAYVVAADDRLLSPAGLRGFLEIRMPGYMIPRTFIQLAAIPRTPSGKVDRIALPEPQIAPEATDVLDDGPRTEIEGKVAEIWCRLLGLPRAGFHDDFFELGGHSLLASRIISEAGNAFGVEIDPGDFFSSPTIAHLTEIITQSREAPRTESPLKDILDDLELLSEEEARRLVESGRHSPAGRRRR